MKILEGALHVLSLVSSVTVGLVFALAGVAKLRDPKQFANALVAQGYLPRPVRRGLLLTLPPLEVVLGLLVVAAPQFAVANSLAIGLLVLFTLVVGSGFRGKGTLDCGCFGSVLGATTLQGLISRNAALVVLASLPLAIGPAAGATSAIVAASAVLVGLGGLGARALLRQLLSGSSEPEQVDSPARRAFVRSIALVGGGAVLAGLMKVSGAEAACSYCGSCSQEILWIGCNGACCAGYWVRDRMLCDGSCYPCSSWRIQQWCSAYECC